jgi:hypothetical protein
MGTERSREECDHESTCIAFFFSQQICNENACLILPPLSYNVTIELQDWHPTPCRDMNCANNYDVAPLDIADMPLLALVVVDIPRV